MFKTIRSFAQISLILLFIGGCTTTSSNLTIPGLDRIDSDVLTHKHAKQRSAQVSQVKYQLSLDLDKSKDTFSGQMTIDFNLIANNQKALTVDFEKGEIEQLTVNGKDIDPNYQRYFITIAPEHLKTGKNTVVIRYNTVYSNDGTGFHRRDEDNGDTYLYSDFQTYNSNRMFPSFDQPDLKASFTLDVKAPAHWQLISTTRETKVANLGDKKHWFFKPSKSISTYVFSLHAGPYHMWQDDSGKYPLRLFARKQVIEDIDPQFWFDATHKSLAFFEQYFDIEYPYEKYDQILVPDYNAGAMENVAAVTFNEADYVVEGEMSKATRDDLLDTIAHEAAHMWFGNLVTMQWWNGLWLNESFASYMAVLAMEKALGLDDAWDTFNGAYKRWGYSADQMVTTHPIELPVADTDIADSIFDGITYGKGAAVVAQLTHYLGADAFKEGVSNYLKKHSNGNTTLDDFMSELAKAANKDLSRWTKDWLFHAGFNSLHSEVTCEDNLITSAKIYQAPDRVDGVIREHKIKVGFYYLNEGEVVQSESFDLLINDRVTELTEAIKHVCPQFVYANADDLGYLKIDLQPQSVLYLKKHLSKISDDKLRMMIWQDLWAKVKYTSLPLTDYIDLIETHLPLEQNNTVSRLAYGSMRQIFSWMAKNDSHSARQIMQRIEKFVFNQINVTPVDVSRQRSALNLFTNVAHTEWGLNKVKQILSGELEIAELPLTEGRRWDLISQLNRHQFEDYQQLTEQQFENDPDELEKQIATVRRPQLKVKKQWLDTFINQPDEVKLDTARTLMNNLFPAEQSQLYGQFQQQLIDALPKLEHSSNMLYRSTYARRLIDGNCTKQSVEILAAAIKQMSNLTPSIHDYLRIAHQYDEQCYSIKQYMNNAKRAEAGN